MPLEQEELLGSVTTLSSPAVRTSARVIQKMKMDSIRPPSPPITERKGNCKHSAFLILSENNFLFRFKQGSRTAKDAGSTESH